MEETKKSQFENSIYADVLQFPEWGRIKQQEGWQPFSLEAKSGEKVLCSALVLIKKAGFLGSYMYIPHGPAFENATDLAAGISDLKQKLLELAKQQNCFAIEIEPKLAELKDEPARLTNNLIPFTDVQALKVFTDAGFKKTGRNMQPKYKLYYDLGLNEEELLAQMKKNTRYNIRLAEKKGVQVAEYKFNDPQAEAVLKEFYNLLKETQQRAGGYPIRPFSTFQAIANEFKNTENASMFVASFNNETIAINFTFKTKAWASSFYAASNRKYPEVKAAYLLRWKSVLSAKAYGSRIYDFWGIVPNDKQHQGYSDTKVSFGGVRMDTYGILALPLSSWKYMVWDKLLPLRAKVFALIRR